MVGIWVGVGGGGGGANVQRQLDGVVRNKLIYRRIAVCTIVRGLVQKYKKVISMHDPYNYTRRKRAQVLEVPVAVLPRPAVAVRQPSKIADFCADRQ